MSTATGIHISGNILKVVCLNKSPEGYQLTGLLNQKLSIPFDFGQNSDPSQIFIDEFNRALATVLPTPAPPISCVLTGGQYHIQKVPLEVAGKKDREDQIMWEATQALISPPQNSVIDFVPSGRIAFWTAIHKRIIEVYDALCQSLSDAPLDFAVEPLALFYAGSATNAWHPGRQAAFHLSMPWSSFVSVEDGLLTAAETVRAIDHSGTQIHQIRQWISGDLTGSPRRPPYNEIFLSGQADDISQSDISQTAEMTTTEFPGFRNIDTTQLPNSGALKNANPSKYTVALGAAVHCIHQMETNDNA